MFHVALHLHHGPLDARIVEVRHRLASFLACVGFRCWLFQTTRHGKAADLLRQFLIAALGTSGHAIRIHSLRKKAEYHPALWAGKFVNWHGSFLTRIMRIFTS